MTQLAFERLEVFSAAIDFAVHADGIASSFGTGRGYLADQLRRAASSIVLSAEQERSAACPKGVPAGPAPGRRRQHRRGGGRIRQARQGAFLPDGAPLSP